MLIFLSLLSSLQLCPVLGVALVEEVHADPDGLPGDDVEGGGLDLRVAEHHLGLRVIPVQRCCCRNTDDMFIRVVMIPLFPGSRSGIGIAKRLRIQLWIQIRGWNHNTCTEAPA